MNKRVRPFDIVKDIIGSCGLDISYFYDNLIFSDHSILIVEFLDDEPEKLKLYINKDCELKVASAVKDQFYLQAKEQGMIIADESRFYLTENEESKEISIHYL